MEMIFDQEFLDDLLAKASENPRLRQGYDLRNSSADTSQRLMNALQPGTEVPVHRHESTAETVVCLMGKLEEILYEECVDADGNASFKEVSRHLLCPAEGLYGMQVPVGAWHSIHVMEPSIIFEAKDGAYVPAK